MVRDYTLFICICLVSSTVGRTSQFDECHDDISASPGDYEEVPLRYLWLTFLQYLRIKDGQLYHGRVPRVVLIHRQYVLGTAKDATDLPEGYSLGNIVFSEYDRDDKECGITLEGLRAGQECRPSSLVMPIEDVLVHPEFTRFHAPDSLAIFKMVQPIESEYMMPICLPYSDFIENTRSRGPTFFVDFINRHPLTMHQEIKFIKRLQILPSDLCRRFQRYWNISHSWWERRVCTSGCGITRGAPLVSHQTNGWWVLIGLASRETECPIRGAQRAKNPVPPLFIHVWPYLDWIINGIAGVTTSDALRRSGNDYSARRKLQNDDPFGYELLQIISQEIILPKKSGWVGRVYRDGQGCWFAHQALYHYYQDKFKITAGSGGDVSIYLNIQPDAWYQAACVKVMMPNRLILPKIEGVLYWNVTIIIPAARYLKSYEIKVDVAAYEASERLHTKWMDERNKKKKNASQKAAGITPSTPAGTTPGTPAG